MRSIKCRSCGLMNAPEETVCRRCEASLIQAWNDEAGEGVADAPRADATSRGGRWIPWLVVLAVAGGAVAFFLFVVQDLMDYARRQVGDLSQQPAAPSRPAPPAPAPPRPAPTPSATEYAVIYRVTGTASAATVRYFDPEFGAEEEEAVEKLPWQDSVKATAGDRVSLRVENVGDGEVTVEIFFVDLTDHPSPATAGDEVPADAVPVARSSSTGRGAAVAEATVAGSQ